MSGERSARPAPPGTVTDGGSGASSASSPAETRVGYEALRSSVAVVDRDDLVAIRMWGRDPARMLNGLITNDLSAATPSRAVYAAMLTPKGRMLTDLRAYPAPGAEESAPELRLDVSAVSLPAVREHLNKYLPPLFARWEVVDQRVMGVYGPLSGEVLEDTFGVRADAGEDSLTRPATDLEDLAGTVAVATRAAGGEDGWDLFVDAGRVEAVRSRLLEAAARRGGRSAGFAAFEIARIEGGRPRYGVDMTEETLPAEAYESTGMMQRAISFTKGCYTGQEVVVRIAHRGHVNRLLRGLLLGDAPVPAQRTAVFHPETGKQIGWTTSAAVSPRLNQTIALAYVRREVSPGDRVAVGDDRASAEITDLPITPSR